MELHRPATVTIKLTVPTLMLRSSLVVELKHRTGEQRKQQVAELMTPSARNTIRSAKVIFANVFTAARGP